MIIERIEVEEGFLDGLDLSFASGLNVLIGPRGVGKTSVIELIRYGLGVPSFTDASGREARDHAISVLKGGRVTVTVREGEESVIFTRTGDEDQSRRTGNVSVDLPVVLSQREIERIGLDAVGRLRLLDTYRTDRDAMSQHETSLRAEIESLSVEARDLSKALEETDEQLLSLQGVEADLAAAVAREAEVLASTKATESDRQNLEKVTQALSTLSVRDQVLQRSRDAIQRWIRVLDSAGDQAPQLEAWPAPSEKDDPMAAARKVMDQALEQVRAAAKSSSQALEVLESAAQQNRDRYINAQDQARALRKRLEQLQKGAGEASRQVAQHRERQGQYSALQALRAQQEDRLGAVHGRRNALLDELDSVREVRYRDRETIAQGLNEQLGPLVRITMTRYGLFSDYASAITESLRGSGVHYNVLAPNLAARMSPRELADAVERGDSDLIAELGNITSDRAEKVVRTMREVGTSGVLTAPIDDSVTISLFDGEDYKSSDEISTGQRCTVVLPILLRNPFDGLILDQPEDHLDNAFIVETVVRALLHTPTQIITSTHNANIPVLGNAEHVIYLGSDGQRGFELASGSLDKPEIVEAITSVMEGGKKAFATRAEFYEARSR